MITDNCSVVLQEQGQGTLYLGNFNAANDIVRLYLGFRI